MQRAVAQALAAAESSLAALRALEPLSARLAAVQSSELPAARARAMRLEAALAKQTEHSESLEKQASDLEIAQQVWFAWINDLHRDSRPLRLELEAELDVRPLSSCNSGFINEAFVEYMI